MQDDALRTRIVKTHLPTAVVAFLEKNADYGSGHNEFGAKGEIISIGRKYKKLKAAIWDGEELVGESVEEVARDMIGHLLLLLDAVCSTHDHTVITFDYMAWAQEYSIAMQALGDVVSGR